MLKRSLLVLLVLAFSLLLGGCGLSPQRLSPQPQVDTDKLQLQAQGQPVRLVVIDGRTQPIIGMRGGLYPNSSTLTVASDDILPKLKTQVDRGLRLLGFVPGDDRRAPQITVTLSMLDYQAIRTGINSESSVRASLAAETENGARRYQGVYTATMTRGFPNSPDKRQNNQLLSEVLSDALDRMFADQGMVKELFSQ